MNASSRKSLKPAKRKTAPPPAGLAGLVGPKVFTFAQSAKGDEGYPVVVKRQASQGPTVIHEHIYYEIVLVEAGMAEHASAEGVRQLRVGDIIVIKPGIWHGYKNCKNFAIVNCLFDRRTLMHQKVFLSLIDAAFDLFQKPAKNPLTTPPIFLHASPALRGDLLACLNSIARERTEQLANWEAAIIGQLLNLIVIIARIYQGKEQSPLVPLTGKTRNFADEVTLYIEEHFRDKITLDDLSKRFHVSPSYLSRLFTRRMGMSIVDYINHLRIETACGLLRSTDWTATRIASEVGYDEVPYFFRRFRRVIGKSPQQYRTGVL